MNIVIEFYRIREADNAHAVIGQETADAVDLDDAIKIAWQLSQTLDMPQRPDAMSISDSDGTEFYVHKFDRAENSGRKDAAMNASGKDTECGRHALVISAGETMMAQHRPPTGSTIG